MGYANATGPSIRHTITLSRRLTDVVESVAESRGVTVSEVIRQALADHLDDDTLAEMPSRGRPAKTPGLKP